MNGTPKWLWAGAAAASLGLHAGIGMALYAMPMPQARPPTETRITVQTMETGTATARPSGVVVAASVPAAPVTALDLADPSAASVSDEITAQAIAPQVAIAPSDPPQSLTPVADALPAAMTGADITTAPSPAAAPPIVALTDPPEATARMAAGSEVSPSMSSDTVQPSDGALVPLQPLKSNDAVIPDAREPAALAAAADPLPEASAVIAAKPADIAPPLPETLAAPMETLAVQQARPSETAAKTAIAQPQASSVPALPAVVASQTSSEAALPSAATVAPSAAAVALSSEPVDPAAVAVPSAGPAASVAAGPAPSSMPPAMVAPAAGIATTVLAAPAATANAATLPDAPAQAVTVPASLPPAKPTVVAKGQEVALATPLDGVPTRLTGTDGGSVDGKTTRVRVADFLRREKDTAECLLALPTGVGLQEASIAAFSDAPDKVARLGDEYSRQSGVALQASTYPVSQHQCGALGFARDLAQYPNFPIRMTLTQSTIGSGQELSGIVSGLRKDTLYLMVVDDEGKAELVQSYKDLRVNTMQFRAPMTLTSGPVSSVQLLVAIASDGPLATVATKPGLPADDFFTRLKTEIITGNHPIAYGIVAFAVR